jgi:uncharacterized membrane protein YeiH
VRASYPTRRRRTAIIPAVLAAIVLLAGLALLDSDGYLVIRFAVSILALIVAVFAWQARHWWWLIGLVPVAVLWNPVLPIDLGNEQLWSVLQYVAVIVFLAAGALIRAEQEADPQAPRRNT